MQKIDHFVETVWDKIEEVPFLKKILEWVVEKAVKDYLPDADQNLAEEIVMDFFSNAALSQKVDEVISQIIQDKLGNASNKKS